MLDKVLGTLLLLILAVVAYLFISVSNYNEDLLEQIEEKNMFIERSLASDSAYAANREETADQITKYVSGCNITIDDRELSTSELVKILRNLYEKNDSLSLELMQEKENTKRYKQQAQTYLDTTILFKAIVADVQKSYGVRYNFEKNSNGSFSMQSIPGKADTALMLYPYYKHKIIVDKQTKQISIIIPDVSENQK